MKLHVQKTSKLEGSVFIPGSKSHAIRALFLATLAKGESQINNLVECQDLQAALEFCQKVGAKIEAVERHPNQGTMDVKLSGGNLHVEKDSLFTGNSGVTTRLALPVLGLCQKPEKLLLNMGGQMQARPMQILLEALEALGMRFTPGFPLEIAGALEGGEIHLKGESSQYLSALLIALPLAPKDSVIHVSHLNERPYVDMTLMWMRDLGVEVEEFQGVFRIPGRQHYQAFNKDIPGDFSSAAPFLALQKCLPGELHVEGLDWQDVQGDKILLHYLENMPAEIDCNDIPDLLPILAVMATRASHPVVLKNVAHARIKETDRIHSMREALQAMGAKIEERPDGLIVQPSSLTGAAVRGYEDHRTVMALAVAGLLAEGETVIDTAESLEKTFPNFIALMQSIGANMKVTQVG